MLWCFSTAASACCSSRFVPLSFSNNRAKWFGFSRLMGQCSSVIPDLISPGHRAASTSNNPPLPPTCSTSPSYVNAPFFLNKYDPKELHRLLAEVEDRLAGPDKEPYGHPNRGRDTLRLIIRDEAPSVSVRGKKHKMNMKVANVQLKTLIYTRHALRHGAKAIAEFNRQTLTKSFLGEDYGRKIPMREARLILTELWRYGRSGRFESIQKENAEYLKKKRLLEEKKEAGAEKRERQLQQFREAIRKLGPAKL